MFHAVALSLLAAVTLAGCGAKPLAAPAALTAGSVRYTANAATAKAALPTEVLVTQPQGPGPHPLLVIAPAKEYKMDGAIFEALATGAASQGYLAVRFNWGFVTRKGQPSADLSVENAELEAVIDHYAHQPQVDAKHVVLAAKSFGSRVAMKGAVQKASAFLLLTPNSNAQATFAANYAPLFSYDRPIHIVIAATDPHGDLGQLYSAVGRLGTRTTLDVLPAGDHNFKVEGPRSARNEDLAIRGSLNWLAFLGG